LLFAAGLANRTKPPCEKKRQLITPCNTLFLHVSFHPANPALAAIHDTNRNVCLHPKAATPRPQIANTHFGIPCAI
jgi:hypothetical protein